jgi:hypothetical protein
LNQSIVAGHESPYKDFVDDDRYLCLTKDLDKAGWHSTISYDEMIDHQVISGELKESFVDVRVVNPLISIPLYAETTSDHLPILSEFDLTKTITGIVDKPSINVFPNPTSGEINFPDQSDITIMNSLGEIVLKKKGAHSPISINEYAPGIYFIMIGTDMFRIVKN